MRQKTLRILLVFIVGNIHLITPAYSQFAPVNPEYLALIYQKVNSYLIYPTEALEKGWEGIAKVRFTIDQDGDIKDIYLAESSGYPLLDTQAMFAVEDASPYPFPEGYAENQELEITLPVNYIRPKLEPEQAEFEPVFAPEKRAPSPVNPEYLALIYQKVNSYLIYPTEALEKGWEGIAKVRFTIDQDGDIKDIYLAESSGYPLLDTQAMFAVEDASPYPFPEGYAENQELEITLPVNYIRPKLEPEQAQPTLLVEKTEPLPALPSLPQAETLQAPLELSGFIALALKNNQPTQVAQQEIELAQLKVSEAQRNFFPNFKLANYNTSGEVYKVDYEEREIKAEIDQPLYAGGRLRDTLNQARVNLEVARKNYDRLKIDVMYKTEVAYYNLIAARMHLKEKETLRQEARDLLEKIEKLAAAGMVIPLELNSGRAWLEQIEFQITSLKQDLFMAELTFKQVLNVKDLPEIETQLIETKRPLSDDLNTYKQIALKNRPEVYLSALLVKFNAYGRKVEESKNNKLTLDLVSSYGYYQGHYKTEPWTTSNNWYAGVKASIPWGANTINSSYISEESQPRFGQTSPTASSTLSTEFNLLDNFKRISDKKKSGVELNRSLNDYNETTKTIDFEVQDAFLNHQKATLQLNTTQAEMKFRRNETEVMKIRAMVGEATLSSAMETLYNLSDAQTKYFQAQTAFHVSLVNLKKACGYGIKL